MIFHPKITAKDIGQKDCISLNPTKIHVIFIGSKEGIKEKLFLKMIKNTGHEIHLVDAFHHSLTNAIDGKTWSLLDGTYTVLELLYKPGDPDLRHC